MLNNLRKNYKSEKLTKICKGYTKTHTQKTELIVLF